jgi:hypothetical protein
MAILTYLSCLVKEKFPVELINERQALKYFMVNKVNSVNADQVVGVINFAFQYLVPTITNLFS